jgi:hypothetical protein
VSLTMILGTGRCGSTMLSRLLHMHPNALSLSEFWMLFRADGLGFDLPDGDITGEEFWHRLARPNPFADGMLQAGLSFEEYHYPVGRGRFDPATGVPSICRVLATVTDEPDSLYDQLGPEVSGWPRRSLGEHCAALYGYLATTLGRSVVIERTGGIFDLLPMLHEQFPTARFVFLHRDGPDCALSMSRHPVFRLDAMRSVADALKNPTSTDQMPLPPELQEIGAEEVNSLITPPFDKKRFLAYPLPLSYFGGIWSVETRIGTSAIRAVPPERRLTLRYERIAQDPHAELARLAEFIGIPAESQWLDRCYDFIDPDRSGSAVARLHPSDLLALRTICASGTRAFDLLESEQMTSA